MPREGQKTPMNVYSLRGSAFTLSPFTKQPEQQQQLVVRCPPLVRKQSLNHSRLGESGAVPLGLKGHLSPLYEPESEVLYIDQLFKEIDKVGEGSFSDVYRRRSIEDGRAYAIKVVTKYCGRNRKAEIWALDQIYDNEFCIQYFNAWMEKNIVYIQCELAILSLSKYAEKNSNICEEECWHILYDVSNALSILHKKDLVHMDIKPDNIVTTYDGVYKLCDFGLMTEVNSESKRKYQVEDGDSKYLAAEVLNGLITPASDIFALGISILELSMNLTLPISGPLWHEIRECTWRSGRTRARAISGDLEALINWMMEKDPKARPTADNILKNDHFRSFERKKKRFNYFQKWLNENPNAVVDVELVVPLTPKDPKLEKVVPDSPRKNILSPDENKTKPKSCNDNALRISRICLTFDDDCELDDSATYEQHTMEEDELTESMFVADQLSREQMMSDDDQIQSTPKRKSSLRKPKPRLMENTMPGDFAIIQYSDSD